MSTPQSEASQASEPQAAPRTASGYIEIVRAGETLRLEHLPAEDNEINVLALEMHAHGSADDKQGVVMLLQHPKLGELEETWRPRGSHHDRRE